MVAPKMHVDNARQLTCLNNYLIASRVPNYRGSSGS